MGDARLRELQSRWLASGSPEDEAAWLGLRFQLGDLEEPALEVAAYLGHGPARSVLPETPQFPEGLGDHLTRWGRMRGAVLALGAARAYLASLGDERQDWEERLGPVLGDLEACAAGLAPSESKAAKQAIYHGPGPAGPLKTLHHSVIRFDWLTLDQVAELRRREEVLGIVQPKLQNGSRDLAQSLQSLSKRVGASFLEVLREEVVAASLRPELAEEAKTQEAEDAILKRASAGGGRGLLERILAGELSQAAVMLASLLGDPGAREAVSAGGGEVPKREVSMDFSRLERFDPEFTSRACLRAAIAFAELAGLEELRAEDEAGLRALEAARACLEGRSAEKEARAAAREAKKAAKGLEAGQAGAMKAAAQAAACGAAGTCKAALSGLRAARLGARDALVQIHYPESPQRYAKRWAADMADGLVAGVVIPWALGGAAEVS